MGVLGISFFPLHRMATVMPHYIGKLATASVIQSLFSHCDASFIYLFIYSFLPGGSDWAVRFGPSEAQFGSIAMVARGPGSLTSPWIPPLPGGRSPFPAIFHSGKERTLSRHGCRSF